jgi:hypothetical protein
MKCVFDFGIVYIGTAKIMPITRVIAVGDQRTVRRHTSLAQNGFDPSPAPTSPR